MKSVKIYNDIITVALENCRFFGSHGVFPQEAIAGNEFEISVEVNYQTTRDIDGEESLDTTISYADLYDIVRDEMAKPKMLLETIAKSIALRINNQFAGCEEIKVTIKKVTPPIHGISGSARVTYTLRNN